MLLLSGTVRAAGGDSVRIVERGMIRQGYDLRLERYDAEGWQQADTDFAGDDQRGAKAKNP